MLLVFRASLQIRGVQGPDPVFTEDLQGPSEAVNLPQASLLPVNCEQVLGKSAQPAPVVTHLGTVAPAALGRKFSHSVSVVAVVLLLQAFSMQAVVAVAVATFQHNLVPLFPLKLAHPDYVP